MKYTTVYDIGDEVWFMYHNKVYSGIIKEIIVNNFKSMLNDYDITFVESYNVGIKNETVNFSNVGDLFKSKEDLIKSL